MVQTEHWLSKPVSLAHITANLAEAELWHPRYHVLIIATSGRFTTDAVAWVEKHNDEGKQPRIEPWRENELESLLAARPALATTYGLRPTPHSV